MPEEFVQVYDALGLEQSGVALADLALGLAAEYGIQPSCAADLGCGTGAAALGLARAGLAVLALDNNPAALRYASAKAQGECLPVAWVESELVWSTRQPRELAAFEGRCDLVVCTNAVGQMSTTQELGALLAMAARLLRSGGLLLFDVAPAEAVAWEQHDRILRNDESYLAFARARYDEHEAHLSWRIVWFVRETDLWWRGEYSYAEYLWQEAALDQALQAAGLHLLQRHTRTVGWTERVIYGAERR